MSKFEGIADPVAMGFEIDLQGKRYVTTEGLLYLMGDQYKKYSVRPEIPTVDEVMQIRQMMGLDTGDPLVVIRGVVETDRGIFVDYGTTSPKNLKGFVKFSDYPLEMACRRATNRAMRIATGAGTSIDEIDTEVEPESCFSAASRGCGHQASEQWAAERGATGGARAGWQMELQQTDRRH